MILIELQTMVCLVETQIYLKHLKFLNYKKITLDIIL